MPQLDGTGPLGTGAIGRGRGPCSRAGRMDGRMGEARGRGHCARLTDVQVPERSQNMKEIEIKMLEERLKLLREQLEAAKKGVE
jgi:hypothetical protein